MASFPFGLPLPLVQGYGVSPVDKTLRTDMEVGAARVRQRTRARLDIVDVAWRFRADEMAAFRAWFESRSDYNLLRYSEDVRNSAEAGSSRPWSQFDDTGDTVLVQQTSQSVTPAGSAGLVSKLTTQSTTALQRQVNQAVTGLLDNVVYAGSVHLRPAQVGHAIVYLSTKSGLFPSVFVPLGGGDVTISTSGASAVQGGVIDGVGGYRRAWISANVGSGASTPSVIVGLRSSAGGNYTGAVGDGMLVWGAQLVRGAFPGPYLRTVDTTAVDGLASGAAWFDITLPLGNIAPETRLARFIGAPKYRAVKPSVIWDVTAQLEVR